MEKQYLEFGKNNVHGYTVDIEADTDTESPREWDTVGTMICWHRRYNLGDYGGRDNRNPHDTPQDFMIWWEEHGRGGELMPLYLYDHSGITMSCGPFSCPWDSGQRHPPAV